MKHSTHSIAPVCHTLLKKLPVMHRNYGGRRVMALPNTSYAIMTKGCRVHRCSSSTALPSFTRYAGSGEKKRIQEVGEIQNIDSNHQPFANPGVDFGEDVKRGCQHHEAFQNRDDTTMVFRVPVGNRTDKTIVAEGKKVAMGIVVVDRQIEK